MEKKIVQNLMDIVIYTGGSPFTSCDYFRRFYSGDPAAGEVVLRDWGQLDESSEWSLSRCQPNNGIPKRNDFMPFQFRNFLYTPRTPGHPNLCYNGKQFAIEDHLVPSSTTLTRFSAPYLCYITTNIVDADHICSAQFFFEKFKDAIGEEERQVLPPPSEVDEIVFEENQRMLNIGTNCESKKTIAFHIDVSLLEEYTSDPEVFRKQPVLEDDFERSLETDLLLISSSSSSLASWALYWDLLLIWTSCDQLQPVELIPTLKSMKDAPLRWQDIVKEDVCYWFDWLSSNRFRCKLCNKLLKQDLLIERDTSPLITKIMTVGQMNHGPKAKYLNGEIIKTHLSNPLHKIAVEYASLFQFGIRGVELKKEFERPGGLLRNFTTPTENLVLATYVINMADTTFEKQMTLRELLNHFNVTLGKVFSNSVGHQRITLSISATMHSNLLDHLKTNQPTFSLLIDASTDVAALPALAVVFQTLDENQNLKVYFYKIIWLNTGESGEEIYQKLLNEIRTDGLLDFFQSKCIGFASDGGSNVKLVKRLLENDFDHPFFSVHCYAHKTELVIKHACEGVPLLVYVEDSLNSLHRVFGSKSAKKKQHLMNTQAELGDRRFTVKRLHKTRWINGRLRALEKIVIYWKTIVLALEKFIEDKTIRDRRQNLKAKELMHDLKDPVYVMTTAFVADCYTALSSMSLKLQDRGVTLIGKKAKREKLKGTLTRLKSEDGPFMRKILSKSEYDTEEDSQNLMTLAGFETREVKLEGIAMNAASDRDLDNALNKNRHEYIDLVLNELESYFPIDPSDDMDVFDPQQWRMEFLSEYGNTRMKNMNQKLKWNWNEVELLEGWHNLKKSVAEHPEFSSKRSQLNPESFWTYFLKEEGIQWSAIMRTTVTNVIVLPSSTAEVERVFSHYTRTKTVRRFNLRVETVDALVRLQINGPKNISEFDAFQFAKGFLKTHARSDDSSIAISRKRKLLDDTTGRIPFFHEDGNRLVSINPPGNTCVDGDIVNSVESGEAVTKTSENERISDVEYMDEGESDEDDYFRRLEVAEILASLGS